MTIVRNALNSKSASPTRSRDAIFNADLSSDPQLAVQRDIFIFHSCIGCRVSDLMRMTKSNIVGNSIEYVAGKTKDSSLKVLHVPLMSISKEILDRYPEGPKLLPFISAQRYNHAINKIFKAAGVTRMEKGDKNQKFNTRCLSLL